MSEDTTDAGYLQPTNASPDRSPPSNEFDDYQRAIVDALVSIGILPSAEGLDDHRLASAIAQAIRMRAAAKGQRGPDGRGEMKIDAVGDGYAAIATVAHRLHPELNVRGLMNSVLLSSLKRGD
jgi:hypothetical protein